jgi:chromosome segregation ATPase
VVNTIEIEITAKDTSGNTIAKANANLDEMAKNLTNVQLGLQQLDFARAFKDANKVDVATAALSDLRKQLDAGLISFDDYEDAAKKTAKTFGLVDSGSEFLARKVQDLNRAFAKGEVSADEYAKELDQLTQGFQDYSKKADKAEKETKEVSKSFSSMDATMIALNQKAADFLSQIPAMAIELVKFGAEVQQQRIATNALAESFGTSGDAIINSIQEASSFTISQMGAMQAANKAMVLDVAKTPEAFSRLTRVATELGKAMGQDATKSIDDFVTAAGRQSKQIADNLGLMVSAEDANRRFAQANGITVESMDDAAKKQAFLNEMLRQGEAKLGALGNQADTASVKIAKISASIEDARAGVGEVLVDALSDAVGGVDALTERIRGFPDTIKQIAVLGKAFFAAADAANSLKNPVEAFNDNIRKQFALLDKTNPEIQRYANLNKEIPEIVDDSATAFDDYSAAIESVNKVQDENIGKINRLSFASFDVRKELKENVKSQRELELIVLNAAAAIEREKQAQEELARVTLATNQVILDQGIAFTDFFRNVEDQSANFAKTREELELEHQENIAELNRRGQATRIQIDAAAEEEKLAKLRQRLDLALLQQSEFTEKTKESTRLSKENQIAELQSQIGSQETLLDDFYGGRLIAQGQNVDALLTAENERYAEELALQAEKQALIEEEQRRSLGRMIIETFTAWATMKGIPPDEMLKMKTALAEEYGLVEEGSTELVENVLGSFEEWSKGTKENTDEVVTKVADATDAMLDLKRGVEDLPSSKTINIDVKISGRSVGPGSGVGFDSGMDFGSGFAEGVDSSVPAVNDAATNMADSAVNSVDNSLLIQSPSRLMHQKGIDTVQGFIDGINEKGDEVENALDELIDVSGAFERVGGTASRMIQERFVDPMTNSVDILTKALEDRQDELQDLQEIEDPTQENLERQIQLENEIDGITNKRLGLTAEIAEQEQRIAEFKKQQQDLAFLEQQLDLVRLIQETGADPSILQDFEFGVNASLESMVELTSAAMSAVADQVNQEISEIQQEAGFEVSGAQAARQNRRLSEFGRTAGLSSGFGVVDPVVRNTSNTTNNTAQFGDVNLNNRMDIATFKAMMLSMFNEVTI